MRAGLLLVGAGQSRHSTLELLHLHQLARAQLASFLGPNHATKPFTRIGDGSGIGCALRARRLGVDLGIGVVALHPGFHRLLHALGFLPILPERAESLIYEARRQDQAAGAAPLVLGKPVPHPETLATAIRIGSPASWDGAMAAREESGGRFLAATDDELLAAYHLVARHEGVFVEPASAASVAGLLKAVEDGWVRPGSTVVCTVTGHGLKDPDTALRDMPTVTPVAVDPGAVVAALGLG